MAALSTEDRQRIWRGLMRHWSRLRDPLGGVAKADLQAAINATDAWIEANQTSFNNALPNPFKTQATLVQKTLVFCGVALARAGEHRIPATARGGGGLISAGILGRTRRNLPQVHRIDLV